MQPSAFDEALYHPFIEERPQRKKWSTNVLSSNKSSNADSISSLFRGDADMEDVDLEFGHLLDQQRGHQIESSMVDVETIVFEQALIGERHNDIINISHSMKSIHTISEGQCRFVWNEVEDLSVLTFAAQFQTLGCVFILGPCSRGCFLLMHDDVGIELLRPLARCEAIQVKV